MIMDAILAGLFSLNLVFVLVLYWRENDSTFRQDCSIASLKAKCQYLEEKQERDMVTVTKMFSALGTHLGVKYVHQDACLRMEKVEK